MNKRLRQAVATDVTIPEPGSGVHAELAGEITRGSSGASLSMPIGRFVFVRTQNLDTITMHYDADIVGSRWDTLLANRGKLTSNTEQTD